MVGVVLVLVNALKRKALKRKKKMMMAEKMVVVVTVTVINEKTQQSYHKEKVTWRGLNEVTSSWRQRRRPWSCHLQRGPSSQWT